MQEQKQNAIQWLRAIAALEVAIWHSDLITKNFSGLSVGAIDWYRPIGGVGVELFFIVSGYVMCLRVPKYKSGMEFIKGRIARIVPMYWIFTSIVIAVYLLYPHWRLNNLTLSPETLFLSYFILPQRAYPILGVGWSLEHEMIFYASLAVLMLIWGTLLRRPRYFVALIFAAAGVIGFAFGTGPKPRVWDYHLFSPYMLMFAFGWAACCATELRARLGMAKMLGVAAAIWFGALLLTDPADYYLIFRMLLTAAVFTIFLALRPLLQVNNVVNRTASVVADASYSLYLSHWFVLSSLGKLFGALHIPQAFDVPVRLAAMLLCLLFAIASFRYVEKPISRMLSPRPAKDRDAVRPALPQGVAPAPVALMARSDPHERQR